ncbi:MAG: choice-of-anchor D domain-containing protein [Myxococcota bacterium]
MRWLLLAGCHDAGLAKVPETEADVEVRPALVDFGALAFGETASAEVTVRNVGGSASSLTVWDARLATEEPFAADAPEGPYYLPSGASVRVLVTYAPTAAGEHATQLRVSSDDDDEPAVVTQIVGGLHGPGLVVAPTAVDLGEDWIACDRAATITLANAGDEPLTVTGVAVTGDGFAASDVPAPPFVVAPGDEVPVEVAFAAPGEGAWTGELAVVSDDPRGELRATLDAGARVPVDHVERFDLPAAPAVDLLLLVDQSDSMRDDRAAVGDQIAALMDLLAGATVDWRLAVVTADDACATGGVLSADAPDWRPRLAAAVEGVEGAYSEALLDLSARALAQAGEGGCNEGAVRDGSLVHAVAVSDEPDRSAEGWATHLAAMREVVGDPWRLAFSAVAGDLPWGCVTDVNSAEAGTGYAEAAAATGGAFLSICSDWGGHVDALADASLARTVFPLAAAPALDTLVVTVDGAVATGWAWDASRVAVVFDAPPPGGSAVEARYTEAWACDL